MTSDVIFDEIEIINKLGRGGFGTVYKCQHKSGALMALKVIKLKTNGLNSLLEASIMATLRHPSINPAIGIISTDTKLLILQLLAKYDLLQWRNKNTPTETQLRKWSFDLIQAISVFHYCGFIHGDIKSNNILVFDHETIRLSDFSLVSLVDIKKKPTINFGTPRYRPPEVWNKEVWDKSFDIWGLGCVLYELLFGKLPFNFTSKTEPSSAITQLRRWISTDLDCLLEKNKTISESIDKSSLKSLVNIIKSCLQFDKKQRPNINQLLNNSYFSTFKISPWSCVYQPEKLLSSNINPIYLALDDDFPEILLQIFHQSAQFMQLLIEINRLILPFNLKEIKSGDLGIWITAKLLGWKDVVEHSWFQSKLPNLISAEHTLCNQSKYRLIGSYLYQIKNSGK